MNKWITIHCWYHTALLLWTWFTTYKVTTWYFQGYKIYSPLIQFSCKVKFKFDLNFMLIHKSFYFSLKCLNNVFKLNYVIVLPKYGLSIVIPQDQVHLIIAKPRLKDTPDYARHWGVTYVWLGPCIVKINWSWSWKNART